MRLDDTSILALLVLIAVVNAGVIVWASTLAPQYRGPRYWALALLCIALTALLGISAIGATSPWRGTVFNPPLFAASVLWLVGTLQFCGRRVPARLLWACFLVFTALNTYLSLISPDRELRIALAVGGSAAIKLWQVIVLVGYGRAQRNYAAFAAGASLVLEAAVYFFHANLALTGQVPLFGSNQQLAASLIWVAMVLSVTVTTPLYMLMPLGRLVVDLHRAANRDQLTGLRNRRGFFAAIGPLLAHGRRTQATAAVLMLDVDRFKQLNDSHGHAVGDAVLQVMGQTLRETLRGSDVAVRWGGEEFCALLINTDGVGAHATAERVREHFAEACRAIDVLRDKRVSVSIGIAYGPLARHEFDALQRKADEALYAAKQAGRDRAMAAHMEASAAP